jgi:exodeoxyribonuclease V alpha subunit
METLKGILERIVYENEENGYVIARFTSPEYGRDELTVVGNLMSASPGENLLLRGSWVNHPRYGRQFRIEEYKTILPATVVGIKKYLGSGMIKGIGPVMAARIVSHFGLDTLEIIENVPGKLRDVPGIGKKRVEMVTKAWQEQKEIKEVMLFLQSHNVSTNFAVKIYKTYEDRAITVVREDPYQLAEDIYGIGFKTADTIASNLGIGKGAPSRLMSGIQYILSESADEGHVYLPHDKLTVKSARMLDVDASDIEEALEMLRDRESVIIEEDTELRHESLKSQVSSPKSVLRSVYLAPFYYAETGVANRMASLLETDPSRAISRVDESIGQLEKMKRIKFAEKQKEAVRKSLTSKVMILTGGPGTGKTTTLIGTIELMEQLQLKVLLAAPTGRAAKRLSETTSREAKTIHRLLEYSPQDGKFKKDQADPLDADVVVIDESSMMDLTLMNSLLKAVHPASTLILVGDVDQLPSVGAGNVLRDLIDSGAIEVVTLTEIFRQAQRSMIVTNAHRINKGQFPRLSGEKSRDFFFIEEEDPEGAAAMVVDLVTRRLPDYYDYDAINDIQVLCPMYRGVVGATNFNESLQAALNPDGIALPRGGRNFRSGDKVMQIRNNYDKEVFNGDIGRIASVDPVDQIVMVAFPERVVEYDAADLSELMLAYAITVHKSQGSEYNAIVMPLLTQHYMMLQRNLLYTAITRAKKLVVLVGTKKAIGMAIRNDKVAKRYTGLARRLQDRLERTRDMQYPEVSTLR